MVQRSEVASAALKTLAVVRLVNGTAALLAPAVLVKRTSKDPNSTEPFYAFRMFGIRTVLLGADLLLQKGAALDRARSEALIIHGSDTICAFVGGVRGDLPPRAARVVTAISAANTVLAATAFLLAKRA
jgi:hypothetical protein